MAQVATWKWEIVFYPSYYDAEEVVAQFKYRMDAHAFRSAQTDPMLYTIRRIEASR